MSEPLIIKVGGAPVIPGVRWLRVTRVEMKRAAFNFIKRVLSSRTGQILFVAHLVISVYALAERQKGGNPWHFHYHYESPLMKALLIVDSPMLDISRRVVSPLIREGGYANQYSPVMWLVAAFIFFCVLIQWWFIGYGLEFLVKSAKDDRGAVR